MREQKQSPVFLVFYILCLICNAKVYALDPDSTSSIHSSYSPLLKPKLFLSTLANDFVEQTKSPFHLTGKHFLYVGAGIVATAILIKEDESIDRRIRYLKRDHGWIKQLSPQITELGSNYGIAEVILFEAYGLAFNNVKAQETGLLAIQAIITSGVWTRFGKLLSGRERPSAAYAISHEAGGEWYGPFAQFESPCKHYPVSAFDGFPSGHMATAFSIATVFAMQYSSHKAIPPIAYSVAALVGVSRLTEHTHWTSDVFAGSALGYLCARQVVSNYRKRKEHDLASLHKPSVEITGASITNKNYDLSMRMTF